MASHARPAVYLAQTRLDIRSFIAKLSWPRDSDKKSGASHRIFALFQIPFRRGLDSRRENLPLEPLQKKLVSNPKWSSIDRPISIIKIQLPSDIPSQNIITPFRLFLRNFVFKIRKKTSLCRLITQTFLHRKNISTHANFLAPV